MKEKDNKYTISHNDPQTNENENHLIGNILAEDNSGKVTRTLQYLPCVDSEGEDNRSAGKMGYLAGFGGLPVTTPYMGAFSHIPDRVGSAPAVDLSVVIPSLMSNKMCHYRNLEILGMSLLRAGSTKCHLLAD